MEGGVIDRLVAITKNRRDRAMIALVLEAGIRLGELGLIDNYMPQITAAARCSAAKK